jgi:putative selenium metabolism protein SsnA
MLLKNCTAVRLSPAKVDEMIDIRIRGTRIARVGKVLAPESGEVSVDLSGKIVMPGLVCGHNHFYSGLARGIIADIKPAHDFVSNLTNLWWRLDRALDEESLFYSGLVCCADAIRSGCTAVIDHHASPTFIEGSLDVLKGCFEQTGLRGVECYEATDRNGAAGLEAGIEENRRFAVQAAKEKEANPDLRLVEALVGGHAPFTLNDSGLTALGHVVEETGRGFHVHLSEDRFDPSHSHRYYGLDPLERLDNYGLVTGKSLFAHGIYMTENERTLLNERGAALAHNCRSNMNNGVGYNYSLEDIDTVCIGTDGIASDMLEEVKFAYFKHRDAGGHLQPADFAGFLQNGSEVLSRCFDDEFGGIAPGCKADLTVFDYTSPTPFADANLAGHLIFGIGSKDTHSVMVNGRFIYQDRKFPDSLDGVFRDARKAAAGLWKRFNSFT